jgi:hypothetical protein
MATKDVLDHHLAAFGALSGRTRDRDRATRRG